MRTCLTMLAATLFLAGELPAQSAEDLLQIEIAAAQRAVSGGNIARNLITVEGRYAAARVAPGTPAGGARPTERTEGIRNAVTAPSTYRRPYGETLLLLSEPQVSGDAAEVTTTLYRMTPTGRREFDTFVMTLRRTGSGWVVQSAERLGSS